MNRRYVEEQRWKEENERIQREAEERQREAEERQREENERLESEAREREAREREDRERLEKEAREREEEKNRERTEREENQRILEEALFQKRQEEEAELRKRKEEQEKMAKEHADLVASSKTDEKQSEEELAESKPTLTKDVSAEKLIKQQHSLYDVESDEDDEENVVDVLKLAKRYFVTVRISLFLKTIRIFLDLFNVSFPCNNHVTPDELIDVMMSGDIMWNSPKDTDKKSNAPIWFQDIIESQRNQMRIQDPISLETQQKMWTTIHQNTKAMKNITDVGRDFFDRRFRDQILPSFACQVVRILVERCLFIGKSLKREMSVEFISHFVHDLFQIRRDDFARNCKSINDSIETSPFLSNYKDSCSSLEMYFKTFDDKKGQNMYIFSIFAGP